MTKEERSDAKLAFIVLAVVAILFFAVGRASAVNYEEATDGIVIGRSAYEFRQSQRDKIWNEAYKKADWWTRHFGNVCPNCPVPEFKNTYSKEQQDECDKYLKGVFGNRYTPDSR